MMKIHCKVFFYNLLSKTSGVIVMKTFIKCDCVKNNRELKNQTVFYGQIIVFENGKRLYTETYDKARIKQSHALHDARIMAAEIMPVIHSH